MASTQVFCGTFIHSTDKDPLIILENTIIGVQRDTIIFIDNEDKIRDRLEEYQLPNNVVKYLTSGQFIIPGFVDTHAHASQYTFCGKGMDKGLLDWLDCYTFPTEARFKDTEFARDVYSKVVDRFLKNGTTTASYYATIHTDTSILLCKIIEKYGQRALVGKVNVDMEAPEYYIEDTTESVAGTEAFVKAVTELENPLITPCVTPRFAVSCSEELLKKVGQIAEQFQLPIQTHLSECRPECNVITSVHPKRLNYTDVYNHAGLLTNRTILAHSIYLCDEEIEVIKLKGCGISHCPNSNLTLRSGLLNTRTLLDKNIKIGLGTDIAGGYSPSMLNAIRQTIQISNTHAILAEKDGEKYKPLSFKEVFRLATLGGSQVLGLGKVIGNFEIGKQFDALIIDPQCTNSAFDIFDTDENKEDFLEKFLFMGDDRNIKSVYVAGRCVYEAGKRVVLSHRDS
ncbi:guanine deaminase [Patella vulgata]|uniref:guanine deaminase n=1 Tax=Patella vulgata TaxID=6465 RepID=UPI00218025DA|nr:guanine deaminase [Patella vulgata]